MHEPAGPCWGLSVPLPALRSTRNWGVGDWGDMPLLLEAVALAGGSFVAVERLDARHVMHIDVHDAIERHGSEALRRRLYDEALQQRIEALREAPRVDPSSVVGLKGEMLSALYAEGHHPASDQGVDTWLEQLAREQWRCAVQRAKTLGLRAGLCGLNAAGRALPAHEQRGVEPPLVLRLADVLQQRDDDAGHKLPVLLEALPHDARWRAATAALCAEPPAPRVTVPPLREALVPRATYRVQLHRGFGFADAQRLVPYLHRLGISHLYVSPVLKARAGSLHGYDVVDHEVVNPELGGEAGFEALCRTLAAHDMKLLLDVVPNHMGVHEADNPWWLDVLEHGRASRYADHFDIDWTPATGTVHEQVLMPVLGMPYGEALMRGELTLSFNAAQARLELRYHAHRFPIDPQTYGEVLRVVVPELQPLIDAFDALPLRAACTDPAQRIARAHAAELLRRRLVHHLPEGDMAWAPEALDQLIARQAWRIAYWRVGDAEINYRRFFDIDGLAAVRVERPEVFEAVHRRVFDWLLEGHVAALRVDHPDGLADPRGYFERLQQRHVAMTTRPLYLAIEKIVGDDERCLARWPVHGDTGYRFAGDVCALFVDASNEAAFNDLYAGFTGETADFDTVVHEAKRQVIGSALATDLEWLVERAWRLGREDASARDFVRAMLREVLTELAAGLPVYRTYLDGGEPSPDDRALLATAADAAKRWLAPSYAPVVDWLHERLLRARDGDALAFLQRFQQFCAPVTAKAVEDTALYRYHRLVCLNDVASDPRRFGLDAGAFHERNAARARHLPHTMLASSTHDSKRSEDVRLRLAVLSEMPQAWQAALERWREMAGDTAVSPGDLCLLLQTLVGLWPMDGTDENDEGLEALRRRVADYMRKAVREAKRHTGWTDPDPGYEDAVQALVDTLFSSPTFLASLRAFVAPVSRVGACNSLAMLACKLTAPGVPDFYQGCERMSFSLVDPDNRRTPPFDELARQLDALRDASPAALARQVHDGRAKQYIAWRLLQLRAREPALFEHGDYRPLAVSGRHADHALAFARDGHRCITIVGRRLWGLSGGQPQTLLDGARCWGDTAVHLPAGPGWRDELTGRAFGSSRHLPLAEALATWPVAVLIAPKAQ